MNSETGWEHLETLEQVENIIRHFKRNGREIPSGLAWRRDFLQAHGPQKTESS